MQEGRNVLQVILGLMHAVGIVLMAAKQDTLQDLAGICGEEGYSLGMSIRTDKSEVMVFNDKKGKP